MHAKEAMKRILNILQIEKKDMKAICVRYERLKMAQNIRDQASMID